MLRLLAAKRWPPRKADITLTGSAVIALVGWLPGFAKSTILIIVLIVIRSFVGLSNKPLYEGAGAAMPQPDRVLPTPS